MGKLGVGPMQTYWGEGDVWCVEGVGVGPMQTYWGEGGGWCVEGVGFGGLDLQAVHGSPTIDVNKLLLG